MVKESSVLSPALLIWPSLWDLILNRSTSLLKIVRCTLQPPVTSEVGRTECFPTDFFNHHNVWGVYAMGDEQGLLVCT